MPHKFKAWLAAVANGFAAGMLGGIAGAVACYLLTPSADGAQFAALADFAWSLIYWTSGGFLFGSIAGAILGWRLVRQADKREMNTVIHEHDITRSCGQ